MTAFVYCNPYICDRDSKAIIVNSCWALQIPIFLQPSDSSPTKRNVTIMIFLRG
jgi:hypothetical protein